MQKEKDDTSLKNDFLAAYHSILFSKTTGNEVDVERRRLAVKYMTAKKFESEGAAAILLNQGLKQYESVIEKSEHLKKIPCPENKDRLKWRTSLKDVQQALSLVKPLPCQTKSSDTICGRRELVDRDVENLIKSSEINEETTIRKVPATRQESMALQNCSRFEQRRISPVRSDRYQNNSRIQGQNRRDFERTDENEELIMRKQQRRDFGRIEEDEEPRMIRNQRRDFDRMEKDEEPRIKRQQRRDFDRMEKDEEPRIKRQNKRDFDRLEKDEDSRKDDNDSKPGPFRTAREELQVQQNQKQTKKSLGGKAAINSKFVCPFKRDKEREEVKKTGNSSQENEPEDERLRGIDEKLIELVRNEIMDSGAFVSWDDVAGLEHAKKIIKEIVVLPMLRPDIFTGLRRPPKGILLFGPPGTGKTLIGKCIASQSKSTFFSISASSLTSKWIGEGEKMVRALFAVARVHQPSVIFMDEIDSLLTQRSETEHESSRRIKTEFLVQLDGAATGEEDRILVIGATNRPQELDEAARRRFVKRLYVPLPEFEARRQIVVNLLAAERHELTSQDIDNIASLSEHYSGADMTNLCKEASMGPIRSIPYELLENIRKEDVRCVTAEDFHQALSYVRPSVSQSDLGLYVNWDRTYGSGTASINCSKA